MEMMKVTFVSIIKKFITKFFTHKSTMAFLILVVLIIFFAILTPNHSFVSSASINVFLRLIPEIALMTLGMGLLIICGEIDLSIGSIYVFSAVILAALYTQWSNLFIVMFMAIGAGVIMGVINGFVVVKTKLSSFIVTIGSMWAFRGIMLVIVGGYAISIFPTGIEKSFLNLFVGTIAGIPLQFIWLIIITLFLWLLLDHTRFGNWVFATGGNPNAAIMMGINTNLVKIVCFAISGFLCAFAGFLQVSRMCVAIPQSGQMVMLYAIAGAVIGGTRLGGGSGHMLSVLLGAFIIQVIILGLIMLGFIEYYTNIVVAIALILTGFIYSRLKYVRKF